MDKLVHSKKTNDDVIGHVIQQPHCFFYKPSKIFSEMAEQIEAKLYTSNRLSMRNKMFTYVTSDKTFQVHTRRDHLRLTRGDRRLVDDTSAPLHHTPPQSDPGSLPHAFPPFKEWGSRRFCPNPFIRWAALQRASAQVLPQSEFSVFFAFMSFAEWRVLQRLEWKCCHQPPKKKKRKSPNCRRTSADTVGH